METKNNILKNIVPIGFIILAFFYAMVDPFASNSNLPGCIVYENTGLFCPGCGMQRALHAFFTGRFLLAFKMNPLITLFIMVLIYDVIMMVFGLEKWRFVRQVLTNNKALLILALSLLLFAVFRNLPFEQLNWLRPVN